MEGVPIVRLNSLHSCQRQYTIGPQRWGFVVWNAPIKQLIIYFIFLLKRYVMIFRSTNSTYPSLQSRGECFKLLWKVGGIDSWLYSYCTSFPTSNHYQLPVWHLKSVVCIYLVQSTKWWMIFCNKLLKIVYQWLTNSCPSWIKYFKKSCFLLILKFYRMQNYRYRGRGSKLRSFSIVATSTGLRNITRRFAARGTYGKITYPCFMFSSFVICLLPQK